MNFVGKFDFSQLDVNAGSGGSVDVLPHGDGLANGDHQAIIVPDAGLLFSGDYKRAGLDLVLSKSGHDYIVHDYFKGHHRATLASPDGAHLSGDLVHALTGEVQVAQAGGGTSAATVIGRVTKLTGSATAIRNGVSIQLNVGDNVNKGDVVQAGAESSLGLTFIDGTVFGLSANARMVLNEMVYDPNGSANSSLLSLVQGTITFVAGETAKHGDMKVDTPVATMGIRGTAVLVEIGFEVPGQGTNAPPVKFQVLVEPGGRTGSYVLYSKSQPDVIIGTVDQAGQVTSVTGLGDTSTAPATPLNPLAQAIIQQTLQQYFPNYVPSANPQSNPGGTGSSPPAPVPGSSNPDKLQFSPPPDVPVGVPTTVPISVPGAPAGTPPISVTVTNFNATPTIVVTPVANKNNVDIAGQVTITDPDQNDVAVPYVAGTGRILSVAGPANIPAGVDLASLVSIDPATGHVSYNPSTLTFLGQGQSVVVTVGFDSQSGPSTFHETLTLTIDGANDAPVVTVPLTTVVHQGAAPVTTNLLAGASDVDDGETATLTVSGVHYVVNGGTSSTTAPAGVTLTGTTLSVDPADPAFRHLAVGQTTTIVVSYNVTDVNGASVPQTETVTVTGSNDVPVVTAALTNAITAGAAVFTANLLAGASDPDDGETATLSVTGVHYVVNGGTSTTTAPAGVALTGATLSIDPTNAAFTHLALGQTTTIVVSYNVTDVNGATVPQTETITITGTNDAPVVAAVLTSATTEGAVAFTTNLLTGASDPDDGETATLSITGVHYAINGGTSSTTAPAGIALTGATLSVDPTNVAFNHLALGQTTTIVVSYNVTDINGATVPQTETIVVTGTNDAPVVAAALTAAATEGAIPLSLNLLSGASDPDDGETATLTITGVHYALNGGASSLTPPAGITLTGATLSVDPTNAAFNHLAVGQTTTIVVSYNVTDIHGATVPQTETITITGTNDAPVVAAALTSATTEGLAAFTTNLLTGASDPDDGETATLTVSGVHYTINGGASTTAAPAGITLTGATLSVDPTNAAFTHLALGQTTTIVVSYNVTDVHGATVPQTETITITGTNEAPVVAAALTSGTTEGVAAFTTSLLTGASDPDDGETATLIVTGVHYAVNGGTSSVTPPAGITLTGATLNIDPTNAAFNHLAVGQTATIAVSYNVTDVNGATVPQTETIVVTGTNDAPIVAAALTSATTEGAAAFTTNLLTSASDPDDGETATLSVTGVHYAINGGTSSLTAPAGVTLTGATLSVDPTNAAFNHLGLGQTTTIVVIYNVTDVHGATVPQTETITVTGTNDAPVVTAALISSTSAGALPFTANLLAGASDPDDGETATLTVSGVHYAIDGGTSSTTAPAGVTLTGATLGIDPTNAAFSHLSLGQTTTIVVSYNVTDVHGATVPQTETITVTGTNDAPVVAAALTSATTEGAAAFTTNLLTGASDPDDGETATLTVSGVHYVVNGGASSVTPPAGITLTGATLGIDPTNAAFNHLAVGQTATIVVSYNVTDINGATVPQTETIVVTGTNDAPVVAAALTATATEGAIPLSVNLLSGASDPDDGETATLTVSGVHYTINGGTSTTAAPAGITLIGATLGIDPTNAAFNHLAVGQTTTIVVSYNVTDVHGATVPQTETVTITGTNDAPVVAAALTSATTEGVAAFTTNLLTSASDPDDGETATLTITGVHYAVNGGTSSVTPPAGITLTGATLGIDPTNAAFSHLSLGQTTTIVVSYNVTDVHGATVPQTETITVTGTNHAPTVSAAVAGGGLEDTTFAVNLLQNATDVDDGSVLHVANLVWTDAPTSATLPAGFVFSGNSITVDATGGAYQGLAQGQTFAAHFSYDVVDQFGALVHQTATVTITGTNDAPTITSVTLNVTEGGTVVLSPANITVNDPDSTSFTFTATNVVHGVLQVTANGTDWVDTTAFTSADLTAGHVRFVDDGSALTPSFSLTASDGIDNSATVGATINFTTTTYHLTSTAGVSIDISPFGATSGFTFPGAGNVTTPGVPEDRIVLGYTIGESQVVLNADPLLATTDFTPVSNTLIHNADGSNAVSTVLGAGNDITLTQTITLGGDANFFTTTVDVFNGGTTTLNNVRFLRNIDPDQDQQAHGDFTTLNDVVQNPTGTASFAIVSAVGPESGVQVALVGLGGDWRGSVFGFTNTDPFDPGAFDAPVDPNGAQGDLAISLTYNFGTILAGQTVEITYFTTDNVATAGANALFGTTGNDVIDGLGGDDLMIGLGGADTFVVKTGYGHDTIYDFTPGTDKIELDFSSTFDPDNTGSFNAWLAAHATQLENGDVLIDPNLSHPGQTTILLKNTAIGSLHASDFIVHFTDTAPVAVADTNSVAAGASATIGNLLANDTDADNDTLTISSVTADAATSTTFTVEGTYGELVVTKATGAYTYTLGTNLDQSDPTHAAQAAAVLALGAGVTAQELFSYTANDGHLDSNVAELSIAITGSNSAPVVTAALTRSTTEGAPAFTANLLTGATDPNDGETATLSITSVRYAVNGGIASTTLPAGVTLTGATLGINPTNAAFNHLAAGQTSTIVISYNVTDVHGASVPQTETVTVTGTNDAPLVAAALTSASTVGASAFTANLLTGASDPDDGETATLAIAGVHYAVDGGTSSTTPPAGVTLTGTTLSVDPTNAAFSHIAAGQTSTIVVSYNVTDIHGATVAQTETVTITGSNSAPVVTAVLTRSTTEGATPFNANLLTGATDPNDGETATLTVTGVHYAVDGGTSSTTLPAGVTLTGATLGIDPTNAAFNHLAAGQTSTIVVSYNVTDVHGASVPQTETITITGTNDAPVITGGSTTGSVMENQAVITATGQLTAVDPDDGATATWTVVGGSGGSSADYHFRMDSFVITRGAGASLSTTLDDEFSDGVPPPSSPPFGSGQTTTYNVVGGFTESGGALHLDGSNAVTLLSVGTTDPFVGQIAEVRTNIDPSNTTNGLKQNTTFNVTGVFDLVLPNSPRQEYGIRLTDRLVGGSGTPPDQPGDDTISLTVLETFNGNYVVSLRDFDFLHDTVINLASLTLTPPTGADQIALHLNHVANTNIVTASFDYLHAGTIISTQTFTTTAPIFNNENWTRAEIIADAPATDDTVLTGTYGTLNVTQSGIWTYTLNNSRATTQALAQGEHRTETFTIQVADQFGASDSRVINIDVVGANDAPVVAGPLTSSTSVGAPAFTANLLGGASDPDNGETATLTVSGVRYAVDGGTSSTTAPAGVTLTGSTLSVDPTNAAFSHIAAGQSSTIVVSYNVTDVHGATVAQTETVTITGSNAAPVVAAALTRSTTEGATPFTANLLTGATDPNDGETATLSVTSVRYAVNGGTASTTLPAGVTLTGATLGVDPTNAAFNHLAAGQTTTIVVSYNVTDVHGASVPQTETVTVTGTNDTPLVTAALTSASTVGAAVFTANLLTGASDADDGETATLTIAGVHYAVNGGTSSTTAPAGITLTGATLSVDPTNAAFSHIAAGQTSTIVVSYNVTDVHGASIAQTETITITGSNAAPVVAAALTSSTTEGAPAFTANLLGGATDPNDGETATLTVTGVHYAVDGATSSTTAPAGVTLTGATLGIDPTNAAFNHLAAGQTTTIVVSYNVTDVHGASVPQTETITVTGTNDAPTVAAALTSSTTAGAAAFTSNLLGGATDPDTGETATLTVSGVHYVVNGGTSSTTAPAGITLTGATLGVDPGNAAFANLATGQTSTIVVSYNVIDVHNASVAQTETLTITGSNAAPVITSGTNGTGSIGVTISAAAASSLSPGASTILHAGPGLISGLPGGGSGYGTLALPAGDDNSSGAINITSVFGSTGVNFFGQHFTSLYINNNGNLTFSSPNGTYTPTAINAGFNNPIIAPFWADVDTRGAGAVYYTLDAADGVMTITWDHVGYYSSGTDRLNSFQVVLLNEGGGNFDILYRYSDINWTTGSASGGSGGLGGTVARAGYSAGDGVHYFELPQSGNQAAILTLDTTPGNTGIAGVDGFEVRQGAVAPAAVTTSGVINFSDANLNDVHTASVVTPANTLGTLTVAVVHDTTGSGTGGQFSWTFNANGADVQTALLHSANGTQVETFHVTISDGHGGAVTQDVSVTLTASNADVWTGQAGGTDFDNVGNWNLSHVPTAAEVAFIPSATLVNLNLATHGETIGGLHLATGAELDISAATAVHALDIDGPLINNGAIVVSHNASLHMDSTTENTGSLSAVAGTITFDGAVTGHGQTIINGGTIEFGGASDANVRFTAAAQDTLVLDDAAHFTGTVSGLSISDGDTIRLGATSASGAVAQSDASVLQFNFASGNTDAVVVANYAAGSSVTHTLSATAGNDILFGGSGADNFVFNSTAGEDIITNFTPGQDHIQLNFTMPFTQGDDTSFQQWLHSSAVQQQGADTLINLGGESTLLLTGVTSTNLHVGDFIVHPSVSA